MCLILLAYRPHPVCRLVVAANRDEWFRRPTAPAAFWHDHPDVFAGRDLEQLGTWMGVTRTGRFAALTNFRDPARNHPGAPSRGRLVSEFLVSSASPEAYLAGIRESAPRYNGFSLLVGDAASLWYFSNRDGDPRALEPGIYGLSNSLLDVAWPKVETGKVRLAQAVKGELGTGALLDLLDDPIQAPDHELPSTGVSLEWERTLSPIRIVAEGYGTRSSTALVVGTDGRVSVAERTFDERGRPVQTVAAQFEAKA